MHASATQFDQIALIGNPVVWFGAIAAIVVYLVLDAFYFLRRARQIHDVAETDYAT